MIVAFEGIDASGKATQSQLLAAKLGGTRISFPDYATPTGKIIKAHLSGHSYTMPAMYDDWVFQALMTCNHAEKFGMIKELTAAGKSIVFDRYHASGLVYGTLDGIDPNWLNQIGEFLPQPDAQILIDVSVDESFKRRPDGRDSRYEQKRDFLQQVREAYFELFNKERKRHYIGEAPKLAPWHIVDGIGTIAEVHARILAVLGLPQL